MKRILITTLLATGIASSANAGMVFDFYAGATASMGRSIATVPSGAGSDIKKSAQSYGVVLGLDIPVVRLEGEYNYLTSKSSNLNAGMFNAYLKLFPTPIVKPYIGVGVGSIFGGTLESTTGDVDAKSGIAYQAMLGLQFDIPATPLFIDVEGRGFYAPSIYEIPVLNKDVGFAQYDIRAKIRYMF